MAYTLRNELRRTKESYDLTNDSDRHYWEAEGVPWTIQDYHSCKGSTLDFTEDDWAVAAEHGWSRADVEWLLHEDE